MNIPAILFARRRRCVTALVLVVVGLTAPLGTRAQAPADDLSRYVFATYFGTSGVDTVFATAMSSNGEVYVAGVTEAGISFDRDFSGNPHVTVIGERGGGDIFIAKLSRSGKSVEFATIIGGTEEEWPISMVLDEAGNIYIAGSTSSRNFPGARQPVAGPGGLRDAFVVKLDPTGSNLEYSAVVGGTREEQAISLTVRPSGEAILGGEALSDDFPAEESGFAQGFVLELTAQGDASSYARRIPDPAFDLALRADGHTLVVSHNTIYEVSLTGEITAHAAPAPYREEIAIAPNGAVFVAGADDDDTFSVQELAADFSLVRVAGSGDVASVSWTSVTGLAFDELGSMYVAVASTRGGHEYQVGTIYRFNRDGRLLRAVQAGYVHDMAVLPSGVVARVDSPVREGMQTKKAVQPTPRSVDGFVAKLRFEMTPGPVTISRVESKPLKADPSRLRAVITGAGFHPEAKVYLGDSREADHQEPAGSNYGFRIKSSTKIQSQRPLPSNGPTRITVVNPDGGQAFHEYRPQ